MQYCVRKYIQYSILNKKDIIIYKHVVLTRIFRILSRRSALIHFFNLST